jgi:mono/diheme cytochrome c family protein
VLRIALVLAFVALAVPARAQTPPECRQQTGVGDLNATLEFLWKGCYAKVPGWRQDRAIRAPLMTSGMMVHDDVRVAYGPSVYSWMRDRRNAIRPGDMIVKEQFADGKSTGWVLMIKLPGTGTSATYDGWWWGWASPRSKDCDKDWTRCIGGKPFDPNCIACHGSADNRELTYSWLGNVAPADDKVPVLSATPPRPVSAHLRALQTALRGVARQAAREAVDLPDQSLDIVNVPPGGPRGFVTSSVCSGCHDASNLAFYPTDRPAPWPHMSAANTLGNVALPFGGKPATSDTRKRLNLSPWAEWSTSLMGLAGRDPVFQAQRESETILHPELKDAIDTTCYTCHGVMGKRQVQADRGPQANFTHDMFMTTDGPDAPYGALGRDGVSCAVCHRIGDRDLGKPATFNGEFHIVPPNVIHGPFDQPKVYAMENAIGMTPVKAPVLSESRLCGTCHVVQTPILRPGQRYTVEQMERAPKSHEQSTYLEWRNSIYQNEFPARPGASPQTCQNCHMPQQVAGASDPLAFVIANVEDSTFLEAHTGQPFPHTAPIADIALPTRSPFSRHNFSGANPFVLAMFKAAPDILGFEDSDPNYADSDAWVDRLDLAIREAVDMAQTRTAKVGVALGPRRPGQPLEARVTVENLAGHKFPSGVGFRRAFLEVVARDGSGAVVWGSGLSNAQGVIVDLRGRPLETEFSRTKWEPPRRRIASDREVQIYETRVVDLNGQLTTSFLALANPVKDNRLMPKGWRPDGPDADVTRPVGPVGPNYQDGSGRDVVVYAIPAAVAPRVASVAAALHYQSLPPYYLDDRLRIGRNQPSTERLRTVLHKVGGYSGTPMAGWKLTIAGAEAQVR